jgi:hypothetical protein
MQGYVELILGPNIYWKRFLDIDFIGQKQLRMQRIWSKNVKTARSVPETRNNLRLSPPTNSVHLATAKVGHRFARPTSTSTRELEICCGSSGVLLEVDRS